MSKITPFSRQNLTYFDAFDSVKAIGKELPTNADYDEFLKSPDYKRLSPDGDYWCRDWIFYPASGEPVGKEDESDSNFSYTLEGKYIPKSAIGKRHIAIRFLLEDHKEKDGTTYLIPLKGSVRVQSFPDDDGWHGFDPVTRIPTSTEPQGNGKWDKRYCYRRTSQTLRPVVRWDDDWDGAYNRRGVNCYDGPDLLRGVGVVEGIQKKIQTKAKICSKCGQEIR